MDKRKRRSLALILGGFAGVLPSVEANTGDVLMTKSAQQFIASFRQGIDFNPSEPVSQIITNGRINKPAFGTLAKELATGAPDVRRNLVKLIEKVGLELDSPPPNKLPVVRDHVVMNALLIEGFAKDDAAANAAEAILRKRCTPTDLAAFSDVYITSLRRSEGDYLYLTAKAKVVQARPLVDELAKSVAWQAHADQRQIIRIVQAALGNETVEDEFISATYEAERNAPPAPKNRFYDVGTAKDGKEVAAQLHTLGLIGTRRSLLVACHYLRSTLKSYVPDIRERGIRYDALDAIRYNFPDERVLFKPASQADWAEVEQFCTKHFGAIFEGPTPDLPQDLPYPSRVLPYARAQQ